MTVTSLTSTSISSRAISGLNEASRSIADSTQRLATGSRFARAGDGAVELAISTGLRSQSVALEQAQRNNLQADSLLQVAFAGASEIADVLNSLKSLAVQANSSSLSATERTALNTEFVGLVAQIESIADNTSFGGTTLLDGSIAAVTTQVGEDGANTVSITINDIQTAALGVDGDDLTSQANAVTAQGNIDTAITTVTGVIAGIGASQSQLEAIYNSNATVATELDFAFEQLAATDIPSESVAYTEAVVQQQAAVAVLAQTQALSNTVLELIRS